MIQKQALPFLTFAFESHGSWRSVVPSKSLDCRLSDIRCVGAQRAAVQTSMWRSIHQHPLVQLCVLKRVVRVLLILTRGVI